MSALQYKFKFDMQMVKVKGFRDVRQTISEMRRMATMYANDVAKYVNWSLLDFYTMVKNLPYIPDPKGQETIRRPQFTLNGLGQGRDCDDKAIVMASYAHSNGIPWRFVVVSQRANGPFHHVYTEYYLGNKWLSVDATYPWNTLFAEQKYPLKKVG